MKFRNGRAIGLVTAIIASIIPLLLWSQPKTVQTAQLIRDSEVIVVGTVGSLRSEWNADKTRIQTVVTIRVDETIKGAVEDGALTVVIPGGEVGEVGEWYSHSVRFKDTEEVVVFAKKDKQGVLRVTDGEHGKFLVEKGAKAGSKIIPNLGALDEFTTQVKQTVKAQATVQGDN